MEYVWVCVSVSLICVEQEDQWRAPLNVVV
jgi:hypothetical protein